MTGVAEYLGFPGSSHLYRTRFAQLRIGVLFALLLCGTSSLWASFTILFNGVVTIVNTGSIVPSNPADVAVDAVGNIYFVDTSNNRVIKVAPDGTASLLTITGLSPALLTPEGLAVDGSGNLYIADSGNARVVKVDPLGNATVVITPSIILSGPQGVAVDASGNLFISDTGNNRIVEVTSGGVASVFGIIGLVPALHTPLGLAFDPAGDLFIADSVNSRIVKVAAGGVVGTIQGTSGVSLTTPSGLAVDSLGHLYVADTANTQIAVVTISNGFASTIDTGALELNSPRGVAVSSSGIVYVADTADNRIVSIAKSSVGYGHSQFGTSAGDILTLPFTVGISATVGGVKVFTAGVENLDFTLQGTNTCTPGTTGNVSCSVDVQFLPKAPGLRRGALVIYDNETPAVPLIVVPLYGFGDAPMATLAPGAASIENIGTSTLAGPFQIALDGSGNMYVVNDGGLSSPGTVVKIPFGGGTGTVINAGGLITAEADGIAIDGAGDLFVSDHTGGHIVEIPISGAPFDLEIDGLPSTLIEPTALAFDSAGNLYIADYGDGKAIKVTPAGAGSYINTGSFVLGTTSSVSGIAVDSFGTIYIADSVNNRVVKVTVAGVASLVVPAGVTPVLNTPQGVAVDGMDNLYLVDRGGPAGASRIIQVTTAGVASVLTFPGLTAPATINNGFGVTVGPLGNLILPDIGNNRIVNLNLSTSTASNATTAVGATSSDSPKTAILTNIGDQPLVFALAPAYPTDFPVNGVDDNRCSATAPLPAGDICDVSASFMPQSVGVLSENVTLTDNALNVANSTQLVTLKGTAFQVDATATTVTATPSTTTINSLISINAQVTDTTVPGTVPTGLVTFSDLVGSTATSLNGGAAVTLNGTGNAVLSSVMLAGAGVHTITAHYAGVVNSFQPSTNTTMVTVNKVTVTLTGPATQPVTVAHGQATSIAVTVPGTGEVAPSGTATYTITNSANVVVASGPLTLTTAGNNSTLTVPVANTLASGLYTVAVNYSGDATYAAGSISIQLQVGPSVPTVTFTSPTGITYGAALGNALNSTATFNSTTVPGTFTYTATLSGGVPFAVTSSSVLPAGVYTLTATFTPTDTTTYGTATGQASFTIAKAASSATLTASSTTPTPGQSVTLTSVVSSSAGVAPTGSVTFFDGTTTLGTVTIANGQAVFVATGLALGTHTLTAVYSGDGNFNGATGGGAGVIITVAAIPLDFTLTTSTPRQSVVAGNSIAFSLNVAPTAGAFPGMVTFAVSGLPAGATSTFSPTSVPANSTGATISMAIQTAPPSVTASLRRSPGQLAWALLLLPLTGLGRLRRARRRLGRGGLLMLVLLGFGVMIGLSGCGASTGIYGQSPKDYTLVVTATSGSIQHSINVTLNVQ